MPYDSKKVNELLEVHKKLLEDTRKRLNLDEKELHETEKPKDSEIEHANSSDFHFQNVEFISKNSKKPDVFHLPLKSNNDEEVQNFPLVERLDLSSCNGSFDKDKQAFIDKLENSENPLSFRSDDEGGGTMLRYGEYSPNNPQLRVTAAAPYLGFGEYEQRRQLIYKQRQADYKEHILRKNNLIKDKVDDYLDRNQNKLSRHSKAVQTDIQNIHNKLVQYELHSQNPPEKELSPQPAIFQDSKMHSGRANKLESRYASTQSHTLRPESSKPKSILSSRRTDLHRDVHHHSYVPSILDGFSYQDREELLDKERLKRETYQADLKQQIEEKRRLIALRDAQERRDQELENRRFEQQLMKMEDEQYKDEQYQKQKSNLFRRTSEDLKGYREELYESQLRKQFDSDNSLRNTKVASKQLSHYSPPISRRVPYSFNIPSTSVFSNPANTRYNPSYFDVYNKKDNYMRRNCFSRSESVNRDEPRSRSNSFNRHEHVLNRHESLSRIDSLQRQDSLNRFETLSIRDGVSGIPRRHSATQQELNLMRSPKPHRYDRGSCSKLDDTLPIPILKAHSPVAKDLKNSIAVDSSRHSSEALRKLEDRWQIPAVQRNIIRRGDPHSEGHAHSTLTQIGAVRMQLQKEQLRMNESFRKRISSQPKAV